MSGAIWPASGFAILSSGEQVPVVVESVPLIPPLDGVDIERPEDPPALLQDWCNRADISVPIPYWAEIWPASRAIARRLAAGPPLGGSRVLDLGCGLGLAGVVAGLRGASVTFADNHPDALLFARRNGKRSDLAGASFLQVNWREPAWARPFDLVLGADVIYERSEHEPIAEILELLLAEQGTAWLGDPCRNMAKPFLEGWVDRGHLLTTVEAVHPGDEVTLAIHELALAGR